MIPIVRRVIDFTNNKITMTVAQLSTALGATGTPSSTTYLRGDGSWATPAGGGGGGGDALVANPLSQFAATTSAQLAGVLSDETGSGLAVFGTSPTIVTPTIASFANATHNHTNAAGAGQLTATTALNATGTPSSSTYLRGDNTWATPSGGGGVSSYDIGFGSLGPAECGMTSWAFDPESMYTGNTATAGRVYVVGMKARSTTISNLFVSVSTAGATLTSGQNFAALYDKNKNLLATSADQTTAWQSTGLKTMAITPQTVTVGDIIFVAFFTNGTTKPGFAISIGSSFSAPNVATAFSPKRFSFDSTNTGRTTSMPATLGTLGDDVHYWAAVG